MKIKQFEIKNYRSSIKTTLKINDELTALIGPNSSGKTNIMHALLLFKKASSKRFFRNAKIEVGVPHNMTKFKITIEDNNKEIYLKGQFTYETNNKNRDVLRCANIQWNFKNIIDLNQWITIPLEMILFPEKQYILKNNIHLNELKNNTWYKTKNISDILPPQIFKTTTEVLRFLSQISYYSASQFTDPSRCPLSFEQEEQTFQRKSSENISHKQFIKDLYNASINNVKTYDKYKYLVGKKGLRLIDDISFTKVKIPSDTYQVVSGGKVIKDKNYTLLIIPNFKITGIKLSPNQLSEGTFKTLALIYYIITDENKVILLEEPEVCVHHGLLNSIMELIIKQSKEKQIIISTHSDFVLDFLTPNDVILVEMIKKEGTKAKKITKLLSKNDFKALKDYLENTGNLGDYWREGGFKNG